jgi:hypothetical protein
VKSERESYTPLDVACRWFNQAGAQLLRECGGELGASPQLRHCVSAKKLLLLCHSVALLREHLSCAAFTKLLARYAQLGWERKEEQTGGGGRGEGGREGEE